MSDVQWHKSSYSGGSHQDCVEVAEGPEHTLVRDTQYRDHGHLAFEGLAWSGFLSSVKSDR
ncbi:hypothetical protein HNR06_001588 [Nocardiopsis arvandica]|jgi:hypothetical protein|uniref:DUF397 domain-containing protein n=1 Tax=Nocardiopsis sinuspersici TaxID=501010 RepID=A0A7Y9XA31_9ACTN|nr:DUF397 domain-containing protein [Nocardiopsis sinuspersici]NYH51999.1 hypothetical protein [Nocardiopsis sinuspersici]